MASAEQSTPDQEQQDQERKDTTRDGQQPDPVDDLVTTSHTLSVDGRQVAYTATAGRMVLREEVVTDGKFEGHRPKAEVFLTGYTQNDADPARRPVTFCFNGGPGSSSIWLHMGLLGPRLADSGDVAEPAPPPYGLADNPQSLLAESDLVFIDPVSTGYSRAASGEKAGDFHGYTGDIESIGEVIRLWVSRNGRWLSPKFVAGESYGTLRAAGLAEHLQSRYGMYLNGLMLISSVLDFSTLLFHSGNDRPHVLYLPTYAAIAHYHGLHGDRPLAEVLADAEDFADTDYPWALAKGNRLTGEQRAAAVRRYAELTGLSEDYVDRVNLRVEHVRFFTELLRHRKLVVGRMDGRFTAPEANYAAEQMSSDASTNAIMGAYTAAFNHYVRDELGYHNDLPYDVLSMKVHQAWSYKEFENSYVNTATRLAAVMRTNPHLKVHVAFGYYDGATPYYAAEQVLAQLEIPAEHAERTIERAYYPAGHMMYVHPPSRQRQSADLAAFVRNSSNR